jgi:hypothetical protein
MKIVNQAFAILVLISVNLAQQILIARLAKSVISPLKLVISLTVPLALYVTIVSKELALNVGTVNTDSCKTLELKLKDYVELVRTWL